MSATCRASPASSTEEPIHQLYAHGFASGRTSGQHPGSDADARTDARQSGARRGKRSLILFMTPHYNKRNVPATYLFGEPSADDAGIPPCIASPAMCYTVGMKTYEANPKRYESMAYARCGKSGLLLPRVSFGLWHNFGSARDAFDNMRDMLFAAFDLGVTHFDLANNYGPPPGSAEENFGRILDADLRRHRDELVVSTKAGHDMWPGPYGGWNSRKSLVASLDQSLRRMKLDYVDVFYSHRPDPDTPLEETMGALSDIVRQGKALYVGISKYSAADTRRAAKILADNGTPLLIHQFRYSLLVRGIEEDGLLDALGETGAGGICFSPLAQGLLSTKYLDGIPAGSRATRNVFLKAATITPELRARIAALDAFARARGMTLPELALKWNLRDPRVTSVLVGASRPGHLAENVRAARGEPLTPDDLAEIEGILA